MANARTNLNVVDATPTLDTSAHADGDYMDTVKVSDAFLEIPNLESTEFQSGAHTGVLLSLSVIDKDDQGQAFDCHFFASEPTVTSAKNAAFNMTDANLESAGYLGKVSIESGDYYNMANNQVASKANLGLAIKNTIAKAGTDFDAVWCVLVSRGTGTYTASGLVLRFGILQD